MISINEFGHAVADNEGDLVEALRAQRAISGAVGGDDAVYEVRTVKASDGGRLLGLREVVRADQYGATVLATITVQE